MQTFVEAQRDLRGLTSGAERLALAWLATRMPGCVRPDHLTALGLVAMAAAGAAYALARWDPGGAVSRRTSRREGAKQPVRLSTRRKPPEYAE